MRPSQRRVSNDFYIYGFGMFDQISLIQIGMAFHLQKKTKNIIASNGNYILIQPANLD